MGTKKRLALAAVVLTAGAMAAEPVTVKAPLQPEGARKPAPEFRLTDSSGKTVTLKQYRGKVVLLDFWATWCHGCKEEIPWFAAFQKQYGSKGFAVVGVSMDDGGWGVVKPFLKDNQVRYRMLLGDEATGKSYGTDPLPDTFLIDRKGRIAAAYTTGLVDREDVEANIRTMLRR